MLNPQELQRAHQDDGADQQDDQHIIDQEMLGSEQVPLQEEGPETPHENSLDDQGELSEREPSPEIMSLEEPGMETPDEVGTLPEGQGELIEPTFEQMDQEAPDNLPADHLEREEVSVTLEGPN